MRKILVLLACAAVLFKNGYKNPGGYYIIPITNYEEV